MERERSRSGLIAATSMALACAFVADVAIRAGIANAATSHGWPYAWLTIVCLLTAVAVALFRRPFGICLTIAILVFLAALLVPNFIRCRCQGPVTACKSNLKNIGTALEMYSADHSGRFPTRLSLLTPDYLKTIPTCPTARLDTYSETYEAAVEPDAYTVSCKGLVHLDFGAMPAYNSTQGLIEDRDVPALDSHYGLRTVHLDSGILAVQWIMLLAGGLCMIRPSRFHRLFGTAAIAFALIPWSTVVPSPEVAHNYRACLTNLHALSTNPSQTLTCPAAGRPTYVIDGDTIRCDGDNHGGAYPACAPGFPRYIKNQGLFRGPVVR